MQPNPEDIAAPVTPSGGRGELQIELLRTIIMEPDLDAGAYLSSLVGGRGHEVAVTNSVGDALEALRTIGADFVVLRLSHETATDVAMFLKEMRKPGLPGPYSLALTDDDGPSNRIEAWLRKGFDDFITANDQLNEALLNNRFAIAENYVFKQRAREKGDLQAIRAAKRYEEAFSKSPEGMLVVTSKDGFIVEANPAAESILGVERGELVQRYLSLVLPDLFDREDFDPQVLSALDSIRLSDTKHRCADGTKRSLEVTLTKIAWPPGHALLIKFFDVTQLLEQEGRRHHEARLETAARVMSGVARDLSDSLTTIRGNLDLLTKQPSNKAEAREFVTGAQAGCESAEDLARKLAALARKQGGQDMRKRPLHLKGLIEKAVSFCLFSGQAKPMLQISDDLWPVEADETLLTEAIRCIVQNADQAMPDGGTLFVDAGNMREQRPGGIEQAGVLIRFRDQGMGIPAEDLARVFDPYFSTKPMAQGLGLAVAAAAARAHGGRIFLDSPAGAGVTVSLWLPVHIKMLLGRPDLTEPVKLQPTVPPAPEHKARVLFMDDDAGIRMLVQKALSYHGFDTYCTRDGQEAIDAYRKAVEFGAPFDVLLMDLDVRGGMGGDEAVARLRVDFPNLKALLTTGYIDDRLVDTHRDHGFLGVLPKPFQIERLVSVVSKLAGVVS